MIGKYKMIIEKFQRFEKNSNRSNNLKMLFDSFKYNDKD